MTDANRINCDDCQQRLEEFALDGLTDDLRAQVSRHLADGCEICNRRLTHVVADFAALALALPTKSPPPHIERDLFKRVAAAKAVTPAAAEKISRRSLTRSVLAAAAVLAACLLGVTAWTTWRDAVANRNLSDYLADLQRRFNETDQAQPFAPVPGLTFVSVRGPAPEKPVHGYIVTDHITRQLHVYVFDLPPLPEGRTYQFWFVTDDDKFIPTGTEIPDAAGAISHLVDLPSDPPAIAALAISDEPSTGATEPTGEHLFQANLP